MRAAHFVTDVVAVEEVEREGGGMEGDAAAWRQVVNLISRHHVTSSQGPRSREQGSNCGVGVMDAFVDDADAVARLRWT